MIRRSRLEQTGQIATRWRLLLLLLLGLGENVAETAAGASVVGDALVLEVARVEHARRLERLLGDRLELLFFVPRVHASSVRGAHELLVCIGVFADDLLCVMNNFL